MARMSSGSIEHISDALAEFSRALGRDVSLKVGFLEKARYPDGTPVAMIAAINEYGAPSRGQPPRPFFRNMLHEKSAEWPVAIADLLRANNYDVGKTLEIAGAAIAGQLRQSIAELMEPPLAPSTIKKKGFDKPLIETSHMINSVAYEVKA